MAAKKKSGKDNGKGPTKTGFIRSLPDRTPAKEVIAKAKEVGLDLNEKFVWTVQSEMRSKAKGGAKKAAPAAAAAAPAKSKGKAKAKKGAKKPQAPAAVKAAPSADTGSAEQKLRSLIVQLGTARADEIFRSVRKQLDALVSK